MTGTQEFIDFLDAKLHELYPRVAADNEALTQLAGKIEGYAKHLDKAPSLDICSTWASEIETRLQAEAEALAEQQRQEQERIAPEPQQPTFTDAQIEAMSADEMVKHGLVSRTTRIEELQGTSGTVWKPERPERSVRKLKLSPQEEQARAYRERQIQAGKAERKRVMQDLRKAMQEAGKK